MKKAAFLFFVASFASLVTAASNDVVNKKVDPIDPIKGQPSPQQKSFSLSKGYFSFFNVFKSSDVCPKPDTLPNKSNVLPDRTKNMTVKKTVS